MTPYKKGQEAYYQDEHEKNLPTFKTVVRNMINGKWKIINIHIEEPQFGHRRVMIFFHDTKEG